MTQDISFQHDPQIVNFAQLSRAAAGNKRAAVGLDDEQAFGLKRVQGLAHGDSADAELLRQIGLSQDGTWRQITRRDGSAQGGQD